MRIEGKAPASRAPRIRRLQISSPLPRVAEVIAVLHDGTKVRGAALRLEFQGTRWKVIALELG
ncbi:Rv3235 family protein [Actinobaculum massiliense]